MRSIFLIFLLIVGFAYPSELININFKDLKIMDLVKITSEKIGKNILVTRPINGKVDFVSNKPLNKNKLLEILKFSLEDHGYKIIQNNQILRIVKKDFKEKKVDYHKNRTYKTYVKPKIKEIKKYSTRVINLLNLEVKNVEKILNNIIEKRAYKTHTKPSISINEENNSLIIDGKFDEVENLIELVKELDRTKLQIYVKANIIEIDDDLVEEIGLKFGILGGNVYSGNLYTFSSNLNQGDAIAIDTSSIGLQIPNVSSALALGASLNLLNKSYALNILSQPSILCLNNDESSIYVGETVSIQTGSVITDGGSSKNSFEREDIGLTLKVKPRVIDENRVILDINSIIEGVKSRDLISLNPDTSKKEIKTKAIVNNGESVILGGLIESKSEKTIHKVPIAGDIPLIGELFKNRQKSNSSKNLVIIVTPYIVPEDRDLSYISSELAKLKALEDQFLEKVLIALRSKNKETKLSKETISNAEKHKQRLKKHFGI